MVPGRLRPPMDRQVHGVRVRGVSVGPETRCAHYDTDRDVVAVRFPCCERFYPCFECHRAVADHRASTWSDGSFDRRAVLCGACGERLPIAAYLADPTACPACSAPFNPGCADHHHLYFEGRADGEGRRIDGGDRP